jgi:adenosylhomocysteine nucleosidase
MNVAVVISASSEWEGLRLIFPGANIKHYPYGECFDATAEEFPVTFFHTGWGKTASAGALQHILDHVWPDLVINLGTCGGFVGTVQPGDVILVERAIIYDILELMDLTDVTDFYASSLDLGWLGEPYPYPVKRGLIASADADLLPAKIPFLQAKGAIAADWESASLAWVARKNEARLLILRVVSDMVSAQGGEVYGDIESYQARAQVIMKQLVDQLPEWLRLVRT